MKRICEECGQEFEPKAACQKYCCQKCRDINYAKLRQQEKTLICEWCEREFKSLRKKRFCSTQCRNSSNAKIPEYIEVPKPKKTKPQKKKTLAEVTRLATEAGLSYGQYVALNRI